jgi:metallo-beta-lactamase family protein
MLQKRLVPPLRFLGAAGTVTGSRFLIQTAADRVLIDCGLFQGLKELRLRNWGAFPVEPGAVGGVVLTHAHLDHSGYIPALVRDGFRGRIHTTTDTYELCRILLPDSGRLQEEEAEYARTRGYSKHSPPQPLYTEKEAVTSLSYFQTQPFGKNFETCCGRVTFQSAGHILGAAGALVELPGNAGRRRSFFSGDLGRPVHPLLKPPAPPLAAEVIVIESTYGDRKHNDAGALATFRDAIARTQARRGGDNYSIIRCGSD